MSWAKWLALSIKVDEMWTEHYFYTPQLAEGLRKIGQAFGTERYDAETNTHELISVVDVV